MKSINCDHPACKATLGFEVGENEAESKRKAVKENKWVASGLPGHYICHMCDVQLKIGKTTTELNKITAKLDALSEELAELQKRGMCE